MGAVGPRSMVLLQDMGRHIAEETGEPCARDFSFSGYQWLCTGGIVHLCWEQPPSDILYFTYSLLFFTICVIVCTLIFCAYHVSLYLHVLFCCTFIYCYYTCTFSSSFILLPYPHITLRSLLLAGTNLIGFTN